VNQKKGRYILFLEGLALWKRMLLGSIFVNESWLLRAVSGHDGHMQQAKMSSSTVQ
jgi:hypothetical protein